MIIPKYSSKILLFTLVAVIAPVSFGADDKKLEEGDRTHDGLIVERAERKVQIQIKPDVNWKSYERFILLDSHIAFKKNWQRDYNRNQRGIDGRVSDKDVKRIKKEVGDLLTQAFAVSFIEKGGMEQVTEVLPNTLLIRPAIIDLNVYSPDVNRASRSRSYVNSAGYATLYLELYDAVSGEILGRWVEFDEANEHSFAQWATRTSNRAEAKIIINGWVKRLESGFERVRAQN